MLFIIYCRDRPGAAAARAAAIPAHLDHVAAHPDRVILSGPLTADDGETVIGSLFMVDAPDRSTVMSFHSADPLFKAGIWETTEICAFSKRVDKRHP
jgi:uncharacterized protein